MKKTKDIELEGQKITLKKWPLGFSEYLQLKALEGKDLQFNKDGQLTKVKGFGDYNLEVLAGKIQHGIAAWSLVGDGYALEVNEANARELVLNYPEFAGQLVAEIDRFNSPLSEEGKKN